MVCSPPMHVGRKLFKPLARNLAEPRFLQGRPVGGGAGGAVWVPGGTLLGTGCSAEGHSFWRPLITS